MYTNTNNSVYIMSNLPWVVTKMKSSSRKCLWHATLFGWGHQCLNRDSSLFHLIATIQSFLNRWSLGKLKPPRVEHPGTQQQVGIITHNQRFPRFCLQPEMSSEPNRSLRHLYGSKGEKPTNICNCVTFFLNLEIAAFKKLVCTFPLPIHPL